MGNGVSGIFPGQESDAPVDAGTGFVDDGSSGPAAPDPGGKFLLIGVQNFDSAGTMSSYLRIGAASAAAKHDGSVVATKASGEDLASLVQGFVDDGRDRGSTPVRGGSGPALDDPTLSPAQSMTSGVDRGARQDESRRLHVKGGWRDHTDGNRITTTRGDKAEVIRGNYKLLVLGRQDPSQLPDQSNWVVRNSAGVDMSGGLPDPAPDDLAFPDTPRVRVDYTWWQGADGKWNWTTTTITGNETRPSGAYGNHKIVNQTWVDYLDEQYGSAARPLGYMSEVVWADNSNTEQHVSSINDNLTAGGTLTSMTEVLYQSDVTIVGASLTAVLAAALLEVDVSALNATAQFGLMLNLWDALVVIADDVVGAHLETHVGPHLETSTGLHTEVHAALHFDTHLGIHVDSHIGPHIELQFNKLTVNGKDIGTYESKLSMSPSDAVSVCKEHTTIAAVALNKAAAEYHLT